MSSTNKLLERLTQELNNQISWGDTLKEPPTNEPFNRPYEAIWIGSSDGDIQIVNGAENNETIPVSFFANGTIYQVQVQEIVGTNTTQTLSEIILLRE